MRVIPRMVDMLERHGLHGDDADDHVMLLVGGTIPDGNGAPLRRLGVNGVSPVATLTGEMAAFNPAKSTSDEQKEQRSYRRGMSRANAVDSSYGPRLFP